MYNTDPFLKKIAAKPNARAVQGQKKGPNEENDYHTHSLPPSLGASANYFSQSKISAAHPSHAATAPAAPSPTVNTVMDPIAALRHCLQYICSHPEIYGRNLRALLDMEVMHIMRLKASEVALMSGQRPLLIDPLDATSVQKLSTAAQMLPPLPSITMSPADGGSMNQTLDGLFGYGSVSFLPPSNGLGSLLPELGVTTTANDLTRQVLHGNSKSASQCLDEPIQWNSTLSPPLEGGLDAGERPKSSSSTPPSRGFGDTFNISEDGRRLTTGRLPRRGHSASYGVEGGNTVIVDGYGYEVAYLRNQLSQMEAAFNSKCIRLHELENENRHLLDEMLASEAAAHRWSSEHRTMAGRLEAMKRELDGWKDRANDAVATATKNNSQRNQHTKHTVAVQLNDAKQEAQRYSDLWRETERALQECRRAYENTVKEATVAHTHLADAFHYIERLERRVARRDAFIDVAAKRQQSLEEKYEKIIWGFEELSTLSGRYSYVDYLLSTNPLWTVHLFVQFYHHVGDYIPTHVSLLNPPAVSIAKKGSEAVGLLGGKRIVFQKTPRSGRFVAPFYDLQDVYLTMVEEVTGESLRRKKTKQLRVNLHGTVACRVMRWQSRFSIDYLGGEDTNPWSCDLNRKFVPILTMASLLLQWNPPSESGGSLPESRLATDRVGDIVLNKQQYDQVTIRFLLHCFWKQRLAQFVSRMNNRRAQRKRQQQLRKESHPLSGTESSEDDVEPTDYDEQPMPTFLTALVNFCTSYVRPQTHRPGSSSASRGMSGSGVEQPHMSIRGVLSGTSSRNSIKDQMNLPDSGRVFFAAVVQAKEVVDQNGSAAEQAAGTGASAQNMNSNLQGAKPLLLSADVLELLAAIYYHTMEYKDVDADFRLFYRVSHQLIPEMVAVNFYASLQALQDECMKLIQDRVRGTTLPSRSSLCNTSYADSMLNLEPDGTADLEMEHPLDALSRVVELVDQVPLVGEDDEIDVDSDGDGYGTILPFHPKGVESGPFVHHDAADRNQPDVSVSQPGLSQSAAQSLGTRGERDQRLVHNIRNYLAERRESIESESDEVLTENDESMDPKDDMDFHLECEKKDEEAPAPVVVKLPPEWEQLDEDVFHVLAPHEKMLDRFRRHGPPRQLRGFPPNALNSQGGSSVASAGKDADTAASGQFFRRQRQGRQRQKSQQPLLAAIRGLLPVNDVLHLLRRHCFATYAVSCCGTPSFSLSKVILKNDSDDSVLPYSVIGQLPPTGLHLQRLRFALALDQPSWLIRPASLFDLDPVTMSNTHLYAELLTLTLDVFDHQQSFLMSSVLRSCAARHEQYAAEGAEDCDGSVPISALKRGLQKAFLAVHGSPVHALAFVNHLLQYDDLLRLEDEVRLGQFADAPLLLNTEAERRNSSSATELVEEFNLQDEAESCSLLHIAFTIRMTYIVWGFEASSTAQTLMDNLVLLKLCERVGDDGEDIPDLAAPNGEMKATMNEIQWRYNQVLQRIAVGHSGTANPLRETVANLEMGDGGAAPDGSGVRKFSGALTVKSLYPDTSHLWSSDVFDAKPGDPATGSSTEKNQRSSKVAIKFRKGQLQDPPLPEVSDKEAKDGAQQGQEEETKVIPDFSLLSFLRALGLANSGAAVETAASGKRSSKKKAAEERKKSRANADDPLTSMALRTGRLATLQLRSLLDQLVSAPQSETHPLSSPRSAGPNDTATLSNTSLGPNNDRHSSTTSIGKTDGPSPLLLKRGSRTASILQNAPDVSRTGARASIAPQWVPVFSRRGEGPAAIPLQQMEGAPASAELDVSKLMAICAALSLL